MRKDRTVGAEMKIYWILKLKIGMIWNEEQIQEGWKGGALVV
jgi:hypothetical protein